MRESYAAFAVSIVIILLLVAATPLVHFPVIREKPRPYNIIRCFPTERSEWGLVGMPAPIPDSILGRITDSVRDATWPGWRDNGNPDNVID